MAFSRPTHQPVGSDSGLGYRLNMPEFIDKYEGRDLFGTDPQNYNEIRHIQRMFMNSFLLLVPCMPTRIRWK